MAHPNDPHYYSNRARGQGYKQQSGFPPRPQAPPVQGPQGAFFAGSYDFDIHGGQFQNNEGASETHVTHDNSTKRDFNNHHGNTYQNSNNNSTNYHGSYVNAQSHYSEARNANLNANGYSHSGEPRSFGRGRGNMGPRRGAHFPPAANRGRRHSGESSGSSSRGPTPAYPYTGGDQYGRGYSGSPPGPAYPTAIEEGGQHGWYPASADQSFDDQYHDVGYQSYHERSLDGQNYSEQSEEQYWQEEVEYSVPIEERTQQQQQQQPRAFKSNNPFASYVEGRS